MYYVIGRAGGRRWKKEAAEENLTTTTLTVGNKPYKQTYQNNSLLVRVTLEIIIGFYTLLYVLIHF